MHDTLFWQDKRVLVTGGNGFLGSWVTKKLVDRGSHVMCLLRDALPRSLFVLEGTTERVTVAQGQLEDGPLLLRLVNEFEVDTILHLAAQPIVTVALRTPVSTFESNIRGTWNVLEAARLLPTVQRVVVASSDKVYGETGRLPYTEHLPLEGRGPYEVSKVCEDLLAQSYGATYGVPVTIARCGNFYGPGDWYLSRIVPGTIRSLLMDEPPIVRSDGQYVRDYLYIEDAAEAYLRLAELTHLDGIRGEAFNFGTGQPSTVLQVVELLIQLSGKAHLKPEIRNEVRNEIRAQYLDWTKAKRLLGWEPKTSLANGLRVTYEWYAQQWSHEPAAS